MNKEVMTNQDVIRRVQINAPVMEAWINSLANIALSLRLQKQMKIVDIEQDRAFVEKTGTLTMTTTVDGEPVRMIVPHEMWSFCSN